MDISGEYIVSLVNNGGPEPGQYDELNQWFQNVGAKVRENELTRDQVRELRNLFGDAFSLDTMQGFAANKPHGHAGDYEIIDRIYTKWHSPKRHLVNWDRFFHSRHGAIAVRNRKEYFKDLLSEVDDSAIHAAKVLDIGSGPCRDIFEYLQEKPSTRIGFHCLDIDRQAIAYATALLDTIGQADKVNFYCRNAYKFKTDIKFDLIWSAGLFDYLTDRQFIFLFRSLFGKLSPGGEIVIGNFSEYHPSRDYMEFGEWFLYHRTASKLTSLVEQAGCDRNSISVDSEPLGVNLFVRVRKS